MRSRLLISALACAVASTLHAQVAVGFRLGATWANMIFPDVDDEAPGDLNWETTTRLTPAFAVMADLPLTQRLSALPELAYVQRGYTFEAPTGSVFRDNHLLLDYLELNVLAKFHLGEEPARPHLLLGPTVGWRMSTRIVYDEKYDASQPGTQMVGGDVGMSTTNLGICAGAGFTFSVGNTWLFVEGRYNYGLTNIWNGVVLADVNGQVIGELNSYDRSWQFNIGWIIPVGGNSAPDDPATDPDTE